MNIKFDEVSTSSVRRLDEKLTLKEGDEFLVHKGDYAVGKRLSSKLHRAFMNAGFKTSISCKQKEKYALVKIMERF